MSIKTTLSLTRGEAKKTSAKSPTKVKKTLSLIGSSDTSGHPHSGEISSGASKKACKGFNGRSFATSGEIAIEPEGARSLKEVDSGKLKADIMRWAKRVAAYARQVSGRIKRSMTMSSRSSSRFGDVQ
ncbi:hypothetical protein SAY87_018237 [Trapa incisa]|uniref:Uncharacterized protein n=1 Tax=Trapa incisa TaxID=236973 RepID=A0AAN7L3P8_9MYRT|nr:hypothetical protein SAY87_018237 [Trapa incisa]